jgi:hypothetical protein
MQDQERRDRTFFTGCTWKEFAKVYLLEVGMEMSLRLGGKHKRHLRVHLSIDPITHLCKYSGKYQAVLANNISSGRYIQQILFTNIFIAYYGVDIVTKQFIGNMEDIEGSRVTWEEMWFVVAFVDQIWMLTNGYNAGPRDHSCMPLLHTLNKNNIDDRIMV